MIRRERIAATGLVVLTLAVAGCSGGPGNWFGAGDEPSESASPTGSASPTLNALAQAEEALMTSSELPPAPPGTQSDAGSVMTAEGDQVSAPWGQVWMCAGKGRPDEGPPTDVEPGALAGAWAFGRAGSAQVDQYAIVYQDESAAKAAVARAKEQAKVCADAFTSNPEYAGGPPGIEIGTVPSMVDGVKVTATFTDEGTTSDMVSTVMGSGTTVQYLRFGTGTVPDAAYVDSLVKAAEAALTG